MIFIDSERNFSCQTARCDVWCWGNKYARQSSRSKRLTGKASVPPGPPAMDGRATPDHLTARAVELAQAFPATECSRIQETRSKDLRTDAAFCALNKISFGKLSPCTGTLVIDRHHYGKVHHDPMEPTRDEPRIFHAGFSCFTCSLFNGVAPLHGYRNCVRRSC